MLDNSQNNIFGSKTNKILPEESINVVSYDLTEAKPKSETPNKREKGSIVWFLIITICTIGIPLSNLFLFQFQPISLSRGIDKNNLAFNDINRS
jgi:hypothetical protein